MKPIPLLLGALLAASLGSAGVQAAAATAQVPSQTKAKKARASVAGKKSARQRVVILKPAKVPAQVAPQGLALALSTDLWKPPAPVAPSPLPPLFAEVLPPTSPPPAALSYQPAGYRPGAENPYLPRASATAPAQASAPVLTVPAQRQAQVPIPDVGSLFSGLGQAIPILPGSGQSILPSIKKVYPTGEKPLVVVSFKCPTEVLGVTPPTIKLLHNFVDMGMDGINKTDLLSFNLQQVCQ